MTRTALRIVGIVALIFTFCAPARAQTPAAPSPIPITLSSVPLIRNADLALAAAVLATTGTDALVDHAWAGVLHDGGGKGRTVRAIKLRARRTPVT